VLRDYLRLAGGGDEPRPTSINLLNSWWKDYDAACKAFPGSNVKDQSDPSSHEPRDWETESLRYWW
jgi:hypothetical protein